MFSRPKDEAFFLSSRGCRLSATGLQSNFAKARKLAGLDDGKPLRPHDLRHRFSAFLRVSSWAASKAMHGRISRRSRMAGPTPDPHQCENAGGARADKKPFPVWR